MHAQPNTTLPADTVALLSFKASLADAGAALPAWGDGTDPCGAAWTGVICVCSQIRSIAVTACIDDALTAPYTRVRALDLGSITTGAQPLQGSISAGLGGLSELVLLDLSQNKLTGTVPQELSQLTRLQWLALGGNALSGAPPAFLGALPDLKGARLGGNQLAGPLPEDWCANNATYSVNGNANLCGIVPTCLEARGIVGPDAIAGTFLIPTANMSLDSGGLCDASPPQCDPIIGCWVAVPPFTSVRLITFNFTGFTDADSGPLSYQWGIGSAPGLADVLPLMAYDGTEVAHNMTSLTLMDGLSYYVTVVATNRAGPRLSFNVSSQNFIVDTSPPLPAAVYNTDEWQQQATTSGVRHLGASWDNFTDPQSNISGYYVQFWSQGADQPGAASGSGNGSSGSGSGVAGVDPDVLVVAPNATQLIKYPVRTMNDSVQYFATVTAVNRAGLNTSVSGLPIKVDTTSGMTLHAGTMALITVLVSLACLAIGAGLAILVTRARMHQQRRRDKERVMTSKQIQSLMDALMSTADDYQGPPAGGSFTTRPARGGRRSTYEQLKESEEFAFVVTDIESSTELSQQDPIAFQQMQEIHDSIMREGIAKHGGYEIITEGDSFTIAFTTVHAASSFCLGVQYRLLETSWPRRVLRLRSCRPVSRGDSNTRVLIFQGPRVRMGLHWARRGTVVHRLHHITRHRIFAGPGMQHAQDIGEAAHGGQVLISHEAWEELSKNMSAGSWPVVQLLGLFHPPMHRGMRPLTSRVHAIQ
ncbi:adenylate cyclase [Monoraphidium neglectum]|uniref:Adenylate cyclase n=1 Tax=Monoraphidium neglectum TaxID=145388 RepID=A0A0D2LX43_9CHLO|nr:adenylate cyclase [Monoraphidium neglectum]KIY96019.1 adenylate cyclase [Monoraphidium neglectum]|eukprot:XP_013895039.1 adenylate cyclase [Monoraphidium neglectum]